MRTFAFPYNILTSPHPNPNKPTPLQIRLLLGFRSPTPRCCHFCDINNRTLANINSQRRSEMKRADWVDQSCDGPNGKLAAFAAINAFIAKVLFPTLRGLLFLTFCVWYTCLGHYGCLLLEWWFGLLCLVPGWGSLDI